MLVTGRSRLGLQQRRPATRGLPAVLLEELSDQPPTLRLLSDSQQPSQRSYGQRLVPAHVPTMVHTPDGSTGRRDIQPVAPQMPPRRQPSRPQPSARATPTPSPFGPTAQTRLALTAADSPHPHSCSGIGVLGCTEVPDSRRPPTWGTGPADPLVGLTTASAALTLQILSSSPAGEAWSAGHAWCEYSDISGVAISTRP